MVVVCPPGTDPDTVLQHVRGLAEFDIPADTPVVTPQQARELLTARPEVQVIIPVVGDDKASAARATADRLRARIDELEGDLGRLRNRRAVRAALAVSSRYGEVRRQVEKLAARVRPAQPAPGPTLILHIGLPKTATTWLQYRVFKRQREIAFLHDPTDPSPEAIERLLKHYQQTTPDELAGLGERLDAALPGHELIVSNENISMLTRDVWMGTGPTPDRLARRLGRLHRELRPIRVVLGIRRQDQWLGSMYAQSASAYPEFGQQDFEQRLRSLSKAPLEGAAGHLDYLRLVRSLRRELGSDNVLVLPSELLASDPEAGLRQLDAFLGLEVFVRGYRDGSMTDDRVNVRSAGRNTWTLKDREDAVVLPDALAEQVLDRFRRDNQKLAKQLGTDLASFGYH